MLAWAREAGCTDITPSASVWCFATAGDRAYWGGSWAERVLNSKFAEQAAELGIPRETLVTIADAWQAWADDPDGWITLTHGEVLVRV